MIKNYFFYIALLLCLTGFWACESQYSKYKIPEENADEALQQQAVLAMLDEVIDDYPENSDAYYRKAEIMNATARYQEALELVNKAIGLQASQPKYYELLATVQFEMGDEEAALLHAQKAIELAENKSMNAADSYALLAVISYKKEAYDKAFDYINQAIALAPHKGINYYRKGQIFLMSGDTVKGRDNMEQGLEDPEVDPEGYTDLIRIYQKSGDYQKAYELLDKQAEAMPESRTPVLSKADLLLQQGQEKEASKVLRELILEDPYFAEGYLRIGEVKYSVRQYDSAIYYAEKALQAKAQYAEAMLLKGRVYDKRYKYNSAARQFEEILEIDPENKLAKQELIKVKRKIAYLRKIELEKQQQAQDTVPVQQPLKSKQIESQEDDQ